MSILNSGVTQQLSKKDSKEAADIYWTRYLPYIVLVVVFAAAVSLFPTF